VTDDEDITAMIGRELSAMDDREFVANGSLILQTIQALDRRKGEDDLDALAGKVEAQMDGRMLYLAVCALSVFCYAESERRIANRKARITTRPEENGNDN